MPSSGQVGLTGMLQRWQPSPRVLSLHRVLTPVSSQPPGSVCHLSLGSPNKACTPWVPHPSHPAPQPRSGGTLWVLPQHLTGETVSTMRSGQGRAPPTQAPAGRGVHFAPCLLTGSMPHMACLASHHHSTGPLTSCSATHHPPPAFPLTTSATQFPGTLPGALPGLSPSMST